jgi:hypothetical protein
MTEPASLKHPLQQWLGGGGIALLSRLKDARDIAHALQSSAETVGYNRKRRTGVVPVSIFKKFPARSERN